MFFFASFRKVVRERKLRNFIAIFNYGTSIPNSPFRKGFCRPYRKAKNFHSVWIENAWRVWARKVHVHNERLEPPYFAGATDSGAAAGKKKLPLRGGPAGLFFRPDPLLVVGWRSCATLHPTAKTATVGPEFFRSHPKPNANLIDDWGLSRRKRFRRFFFHLLSLVSQRRVRRRAKGSSGSGRTSGSQILIADVISRPAPYDCRQRSTIFDDFVRQCLHRLQRWTSFILCKA